MTPRGCSAVTNWTDSIDERRPMTVVRTPRLRSGRRAVADTATVIGGRCFATSPAELRWLVHRLRTAGYRCSTDPPPLRHRRPAAAVPAVRPRPADNERALRLVASTLTNVPARDTRAVPKDGATVTEVQDPVPGNAKTASGVKHRRRQHQYAKRLHQISHILHYCSIAILGIFAFQVHIKPWLHVK